MAHYIDKDTLVAEIEKIRAKWFGINNDFTAGQKGALTNVLSLINTLEVKEVDLDTDFGICWGNYIDCGGNINNYEVAKHFFELGLKAQKGE